MAHNDNLRTLLHEADNDVRESFAADVLRQVGGNLDQARQVLGIQPTAAPARPPVNPMLQSFAFSESEVTPELIALQQRELERLEQERRDRELAQRLGGADAAAAAEAERQAAAALSAEAERQRLAVEAERQRQLAAAAEAERQRQLQLQQLEAERQRQLAAAAEAERQRLAAAAAEAAAAEAERQRLVAAAAAAAEAERQRLAAAAEAERQRLAAAAAAEAERQRLAEAERQRLAATAAAAAAAEAEGQRLAEAERQRLAATAAAAAAAEAERQRLAAAEAERQRLAAEEAERQRLNEAQLLENITANHAKLRADQERVNALASHEKECARMHESVRIDLDKLGTQPDTAAVSRMQEQLRALEQQLEEARRAHQAARDDAERERLRIQAEVSELRARASRPPKVSIFVCPNRENDTATAASEAAVGELRTLLLGNGVLDSEITVIDVSHDREQACFIQQKLGREVAYPVVSVLGQPIGNLDALNKLVHDNQLQAVLNGTPYESAVPLPTQSGPANHGQGVLDVCLDAVEYIGSTVTSVVAAPFWLLSYPFRSHAKCELPKGPNDVDFDVVHTNWYWRNQKRKFRFYDDEFVRIHPTHMDIRATHKYATIDSIRRFDPTSICISYNDSSSPDWIVATEDDISAIIEVIRRKGKRADVLVVNVADLSS